MFSKTVIIGRLGHAPSRKDTRNGTPCCSFSVAVDSGWGERKITDWYNVSVFGKTVDFCTQYLNKGSVVCVSGVIHLREYDGRDGQRHASLDLTADTVTNVTPKSQPADVQVQQGEQQPVPNEDQFGGAFANDEIPF